MTKDEELQDAYNKLSEAEQKISILRRQLNENYRVEQVIVAAGLLSKEKFDEARAIIENVD